MSKSSGGESGEEKVCDDESIDDRSSVHHNITVFGGTRNTKKHKGMLSRRIIVKQRRNVRRSEWFISDKNFPNIKSQYWIQLRNEQNSTLRQAIYI